MISFTRFKTWKSLDWKDCDANISTSFVYYSINFFSRGCVNWWAEPCQGLSTSELGIASCNWNNGSERWIGFRCLLWTCSRWERRNDRLDWSSRFQCRRWHQRRDQHFLSELRDCDAAKGGKALFWSRVWFASDICNREANDECQVNVKSRLETHLIVVYCVHRKKQVSFDSFFLCWTNREPLKTM